QHQHVPPERTPERELSNVDVVGQHVRGVREEEEPDHPGADREYVGTAAIEGVAGERGGDRYPGEHEGPDEEAVERAAALVNLHEESGNRQSRGGREGRNQPEWIGVQPTSEQMIELRKFEMARFRTSCSPAPTGRRISSVAPGRPPLLFLLS